MTWLILIALSAIVPHSGAAEPVQNPKFTPMPTPTPTAKPTPVPKKVVRRVEPNRSERSVTQLTVGLSLGTVSYREDRQPNYASNGLNAKVAIYQSLWSNWDASASIFTTALPITYTKPTAARFVSVDLRVGYRLPFVESPWRFTLMTGLYYFTMLVPDSSFGFQNMAGPQIFPTVQRTFRESAIMGYFKFSPYSNRISSLSFDSNEIGFGGAYGWLLSNRHTFSITFDGALLALKIDSQKGSATLLSFGVSYQL